MITGILVFDQERDGASCGDGVTINQPSFTITVAQRVALWFLLPSVDSYRFERGWFLLKVDGEIPLIYKQLGPESPGVHIRAWKR